MECTKNLEELLEPDYISVDDKLPEEDGIYECIIHSGSMTVSYYKADKPFLHGKFPKMDWNYVLYWREKNATG